MRRPLASLLLVMGLLSACGKRADRAALPARQDTSRTGAPTSGPIGRSDPLMNDLRPELVEWVAMWRRAIPGFDVDSLSSEGRSAWEMDWTAAPTSNRSTQVPWEDSLTASVFTLPSPDGGFDLEIDDYQAITERHGQISIGGEPDSRSMLFDRRWQREAILVFSGTMGGQQWGCWAGANRFALAGWRDATESGERIQGWISIYSGADSSVATYVTRGVSKAEYDRYREAWQSWVERRYRERSTRRVS